MRVILRIRTAPEKRLVPGRRPNRRLASLGISLVSPLALLCFAVCLWRWSYDLAWTGRFLVDSGILFHWQVWFIAGALLQLLVVWLGRYAELSRASAGSNPVVHSELFREELPQ